MTKNKKKNIKKIVTPNGKKSNRNRKKRIVRKFKTQYEFNPDASIKKYLMNISTPKLVGIINACCKTDYPLDSEVEFINTEHFSVLGDLDKNSVRGDLVANIKVDTQKQDIKQETKQETTNKIVIELQSKKDKTMGFRMFVYSINVADIDKREDIEVYKFPKGVTIYTVLDLPKIGIDTAYFQIEDFRVGEYKFSAENNDLLMVDIPFINILDMDFQEFDNSLLEPLKVIYPYKYRKNPRLMKKNLLEFKNVMNNLNEYAVSQKGNDNVVVSEITREITVDLYNFCKQDPDAYNEELNVMNNLNKTSTQVLIEESIEKGIEKGKLEEKFEIAKNLLDVLDNTIISLKTGLSLSQVEQLRADA